MECWHSYSHAYEPEIRRGQISSHQYWSSQVNSSSPAKRKPQLLSTPIYWNSSINYTAELVLLSRSTEKEHSSICTVPVLC
ncbi:hypothetical protein Y032_0838g2609 [Ancylostoma ceylanicum]|uniref:Uncharacterized protein n=1 Tax=Ancylostoma ceylanicum TaxID=53326 RepID=A0A016WCH6_9BILA|nr:hypothetical protein Y032_0838g2609 [Ancylostoma ceylanicum]